MKSQTCPECGSAIPPDVSGGLCPRCLLAVADSSLDLAAAEADQLWPRTAANPSVVPHPASFGQYDLIEEIARGGMGVVYKARQRGLDRMVALKMVQFGRFAGENARQRFQAEAQAAARLNHPHIIAIHDIGLLEGQPYFTMEYMEGPNLATRAVRGPLPPREAATLLRTIAEAVAYAHDQGVLHRDLKPSNILIDADGQPHLTDFGLAKLVEPQTPNGKPSACDGLTVTGQALGSPNYMAPEQITGARAVGPAADVWSLGAVLYHVLTARVPFTAATIPDTLRAVREDEPAAPRLLDPNIPSDLETICLKCLEKDPAKRYGTAQELADELDRFLRDEPIHARPVSHTERAWRWCRRKPALAGALAAAVLFLISGLAGVLWQWRAAQSHATAATHAATRAEANALTARRAQYASDMNLAHQAVQDGDFFRARQLLERYRRQESGVRSQEPETRSEKLEGARSNGQTILTPDSRLLTSTTSPDLRGWEWRYLWRETSGDPHRVLLQLDKRAGPLGVLPDGKTVFVGSQGGTVQFIDLASGHDKGVLSHPEEVVCAAASADGRWMVTGTLDLDRPQPLRLWDLATKREVAVLTTNHWLRPTLVFSPDGRRIAFPHVGHELCLWDLDTRQMITNFPTYNSDIAHMGAAFSPDGHWLAIAEHDQGMIAMIDTDRLAIARRWKAHRSTVIALAYSPDAERLASSSADGTIKVWDVTSQREIASHVARSRYVPCLAFSPDGTWLASASGEGEIWLFSSKAGERVATLRGHRETPDQLAFTHDSRQLLSTSHDGSLRAWPIPPRSPKADQLELPPSISTAWNTYGPAIAVAPDGAASIVVVTNMQRSILWRTDETFGTSPPVPGDAGAYTHIEGRWFDLPFTNVSVAAVAPGGRTVAVSSHQGQVNLWQSDTGRHQLFGQPGTNGFTRMCFSFDGRLLAMANWRGVHVWSIPEQRELHAFHASTTEEAPAPMSLEFSSHGTHLMAGFFNGAVRVWNLGDGGDGIVLHGHEQQVRGLALLPDESTLITAAAELRVWNIAEGRELFRLKPRHGIFFNLALSQNGRRLAAGDSRGAITVWDTTSWLELATLRGHDDSVRHVAFTRDGRSLLSASRDRLRVWRTNSPEHSTYTSNRKATTP